MPQSRSWCFTLNNPEDGDFELSALPSWISFLVYQRERGENGTEHYQGYLETATRVRLDRLKAYNGRAHWEVRRGTQAQAIAYSEKQDTRIDGPWRIGDPRSTEQGKRNDLAEVYERIKEGASLSAITEEFPANAIRYRRGITDVIAQRQREQFTSGRRELECVVLWGDPGTGKTRSVYDAYGFRDVYTLNTSDALWFDGYEGQPVLLIDDFRGWIKFNFLLKMLDIYPLRLPVKGSFSYAGWTKVYITSNHAPDTWYSSDHCYAALRRRISRIQHFTEGHPWSTGGDEPSAAAGRFVGDGSPVGSPDLEINVAV